MASAPSFLAFVDDFQNEAFVDAFARRMDAATLAMLQSAPDANYADIDLVNVTLLSVIFGTVRNVFERNLATSEQSAMRRELMTMCLSYLERSGG